MKTRFYERTAYRLSDEPVPNCFLKLDDHFDARFEAGQGAPISVGLALAESVCARMADVEMYAYLMQDAVKRHDLARENIGRDADVKAVIMGRSFLIGYLGAVRALLDSGATTLAVLYQLPLANAERTYASSAFWQQLVVREPNVHRRYHAQRLFFTQALHWCNETPSRVPPISVLQYQFGEFSRRELLMQVVDDGDAGLEQLATHSYVLHWIDPVDLHRRWKVKLLNLCEKLCRDIELNT